MEGNVKLTVWTLTFPICRYPLGPRQYKYWKGDKPGRNKNWGDLDPGPDRGYGDCFNPGLCEHARCPCGSRHFACHPSPMPEAHPRPQICHDVCRAEEYSHDLKFDPEFRLQWVYSPGHPSLKTHHWGPLHPAPYHGKGETLVSDAGLALYHTLFSLVSEQIDFWFFFRYIAMCYRYALPSKISQLCPQVLA